MITLDSFIVASLLGDGSLPKTETYNYFLSFQHSIKQQEYALYKKKIAEELGLKTYTYYVNKRFPAILVTCKLEKELFKQYRHSFYPNGNKTITRKLLNKLDAEGLSIWWQDDGSLSVYESKKTNQLNRHGKWCTHGFTKEENDIISQYLDVVWDTKTRVKIEKEKYYFQYLNASSLNKLFSIINVCESMKYKVDMKYRQHAYRSNGYPFLG